MGTGRGRGGSFTRVLRALVVSMVVAAGLVLVVPTTAGAAGDGTISGSVAVPGGTGASALLVACPLPEVPATDGSCSGGAPVHRSMEATDLAPSLVVPAGDYNVVAWAVAGTGVFATLPRGGAASAPVEVTVPDGGTVPFTAQFAVLRGSVARDDGLVFPTGAATVVACATPLGLGDACDQSNVLGSSDAGGFSSPLGTYAMFVPPGTAHLAVMMGTAVTTSAAVPFEGPTDTATTLVVGSDAYSAVEVTVDTGSGPQPGESRACLAPDAPILGDLSPCAVHQLGVDPGGDPETLVPTLYLGRGSWNMVAFAGTAWVPEPAEAVEVTSGSGTQQFAYVVVPPAPGTILGTVTTDAVSGFVVWVVCPTGVTWDLSCPGAHWSFPSDGVAGGEFSVERPPGEYQVGVGWASGGFALTTATPAPTVVVPDGGTVTCAFVLDVNGTLGGSSAECATDPPPPTVGSISGYVLDADGNAIEGAGVFTTLVGGGPGPSALSEADGFFTIGDLTPGTYTVAAFSSLGNVSASVTVTAGNDTVQYLQLEAPGVLEVTVEDEHGVPIPGAHVSLQVPGGPTFAGPADANGFLSFPNVAPGTSTVSAGPAPGTLYGTASRSVTVSSGQTTAVTLTLAPATGVVLSVDEPVGALYYPGFCAAPGMPVLGQALCDDGRPATILFAVPGGHAGGVALTPGTYNAAMAVANPLLSGSSPIASVEVVAGTPTVCSFTMALGPRCEVDDGDGVIEPPAGLPASYDGNGDGTPDNEQAHVTSLILAVGSEPVTIAAPEGSRLTGVSALPVPGSPTPPAGADFPVGLFGFSVVLADGATSADVTLHLPAGSGPDGYAKLVGGTWLEVPIGVQPGTYVTFTDDTATLHLVDDDGVFDTEPAPGVIGDPGGPTVSSDDVGPRITCPPPPTYLLRERGAVLTASVADDGSGPTAPTATVAVDVSAVGGKSVAVSAADVAGNVATTSCAYTVEYDVSGFAWPINDRKTNVVKAGKHVPIGWQVSDGRGRPVTARSSFVSLTSAAAPCPAAASDAVELYSPVAIAPSHVALGVWLGTWKAPTPAPAGCLELRLLLDDGVTRTVVFRVR